MAILFLIFGISFIGLSGLFLMKTLEGQRNLTFLPTLRLYADRLMEQGAALFRDVKPQISVAAFWCRTSACRISKRAWEFSKMAATRTQFFTSAAIERLRATNSRVPLTKGSVSLYLQRISPRKNLEESALEPVEVEAAPLNEVRSDDAA